MTSEFFEILMFREMGLFTGSPGIMRWPDLQLTLLILAASALLLLTVRRSRKTHNISAKKFKTEGLKPSNSRNSKVRPVLSGAIRFENINFSYPGSSLNIQNVNLDVSPGERIAVVGSPGSGKSMIANLLLQVWEVQQGRIMIDGKNIRDFTIGDLQGRISTVMQDSIIFDGSVRENICFGIEDCPDEVLDNAALLANAYDFIKWLPDGYDTLLGEHGVSLSRDQRQRIAIARAAVRQRPILILYEPTAGLDSLNEKLILQSLFRLAKTCTMIHISQQFWTARSADKVLYMKNGRILESGTHDQMMQQPAEYSKWFNAQCNQREYCINNNCP